MECAGNQEFIKQYKRLTGARLGGGPPVDRLIDQQSGYGNKEWFEFFDFVEIIFF